MSKFSLNKEPEKGVLYCTVRWSNHNNNVNQFLSMHLAEEKYTDVVIACEGHIIKAHRMILAGCSPYFEMLIDNYEGKVRSSGQPMCIVLDGMGIAYPTLQLILEFMYSGEIRVKKSELESLVLGGVKLKVKGLDAVKLGDKPVEKPNEVRTIVGRSDVPQPGKPQQLVKVVAPSHLETAMKKRMSLASQMPTPNRPAAPRTKTPVTVARGPASKRAVPPPIETNKEPSDETAKAKEKVAASDSPVKSDIKETVVAQRSDSTGKGSPSPKKLSAEDTNHEGSESPVKSPAPSNQGQEPATADPGSRTARRTRNGNQKLPSVEPSAAENTSSEAATAGDSEEGDKVPGESETDPLETSSNNTEPSNPPVKNDEGEENGEAEAEPVSKRRIIKKPARLADNDFVQEVKFPPMKKRRMRDSPSRKQPAEESGEPTPSEEVTTEPAVKKRKGVFTVFCQQFREKVQAENPGESNTEITKRLNNMWKNLDPSEREKYSHPPKAGKK